MSRAQRFYLGAGLSLLLGLLAIYLLGQLQPYTETIKHGPAPEVSDNPYLAAELFLRQQGIQVRRRDNLKSLNKLPSAGQTLMLFSDRRNMPERQSEQLLAWAARGGHLVVVADRLWDEEDGKSGDLLLDPLGIQQHLSDDLDEEDEDADNSAEQASESTTEDAAATSEQAPAAEPVTAQESPADPTEDASKSSPSDEYDYLTKLYLANEKAPAYVEFDTYYHLLDSQNRAHAWANSAEATHMLQLFYGDGMITVLTDSWLWENYDIDSYDNAWLLWYLTQDSAVTLVYRADHDSLLTLLLRYFPQALLMLALLIVLSLWHFGLRQGSLMAPVSRARRQLEEHLRGGADFLLRRSGQRSLLQGLQRDIQQRARRRQPGFERLAVAEQWRSLAQLSRLSSATISQIMRPLAEVQLNASDFTQQIRQLQILRNSLEQAPGRPVPNQGHAQPAVTKSTALEQE